MEKEVKYRLSISKTVFENKGKSDVDRMASIIKAPLVNCTIDDSLIHQMIIEPRELYELERDIFDFYSLLREVTYYSADNILKLEFKHG